MKNIILILTLNIVFLSSMWNCNDKFDEMCEKYDVKANLHCREADNDNKCDAFPVNIKEYTWALFKITLTGPLPQQQIELTEIINKNFLLDNKKRYYSISLSKDTKNIVYLFITEINTWGKGAHGKRTSLFSGVEKLKEVEVVYSHWPKKENFDNFDISELFSGCSNLEKVNLKNIDFNNREYAGGLFIGCPNLGEVSFQESAVIPAHDGGDGLYGPFDGLFGKGRSNKFITIKCTGKFLNYILKIRVKSEFCELRQDEEASFMHGNGGIKVFLYERVKEIGSSEKYYTFHINVQDFATGYLPLEYFHEL